MRTTNKLQWEAEVADSGKGWVTVNPATGNGDTRVAIDIKNSDVWADPSTLKSEVTFRCTNCDLLDDESKTKTIQVCRCACDCDELKVFKSESLLENIPESGLSATTVLGTFSLNSRCNKDVVTAELVNGGTITPLKCENDNIKLINAIPYNQEMTEVEYTVNVYFDRSHLSEPCSYFTFKQNALLCDCNSAVKDKITYSNYFNGTLEIPQSGLTVGTELFRYNIKQFCPENYLAARVMYVSTVRDVTISDGVAKLAEAIGANDNPEKRDVTIKIYYGKTKIENGKVTNFNELEECETRTIKQNGCDCGAFFVNDSFNVEITFSGVAVGNTLGSYEKMHDVSCNEDRIEAHLTSNGIDYPLICSNGIVTLGGDKNIEENIEHESVKFLLAVSYADKQCDSAEITQVGVACNCSDINGSGRISELYTIPKEGLPKGSKIGEYDLSGTQCDDANDLLKLEEVDDKVQIKLQNGMILTDSVIGVNEEVTEIEYNFRVLYNVNNKWRECKIISTKQKGLECSCNMIDIKGDDSWVSFPISGTRGLVKFAEADTGLYKFKGQPNEEIVGVCGSLSADCNCSTIVAHDGFNVTTKAKELTQEEIDKGLDMPHIYEFYVDLAPVETTTILSQRADLYFIPKDGSGIVACNTDTFGFLYDPNACNCKMNALVQTKIPCDGYSTVKKIASVISTGNDMTLEADLLENGQEYDVSAESINGAIYVADEGKINLTAGDNFVFVTLDASEYLDSGESISNVSISNGELIINVLTDTGRIINKKFSLASIVNGKKYVNTIETHITDFETSLNNKTLTINGKVSTNGEVDKRQIGIIRINYWCNKGKVNEWHCGFIDTVLVQEKGCACDCDYVRKQQNYSYWWDILFNFDETSYYSILNNLKGNSECAYYYIDGDKDDEGYVDLDWCKVKAEKDNNEWVLYGEITDGTHENRSTSVTVHYGYISGTDDETGEPIYVECGKQDVTVADSVCDCDAINDDNFEDLDIVISAGQSYGYASWYSTIFNVSDCIQLYIDDNGVAKGTSSSDRYIYKDGDEDIFNAYVDGTYVYVSLLNDLDQSKTYSFTVKTRYKLENGEWSEPCDKEATVTVTQKLCTCRDFENKVSTYTYFNYDQSSSGERTIDVAYVNDSCGKGTLFVVDSNGNKYCANDINNLPDELSYIKGISEPCSRGYLSLVVDSLDEDNQSRETEIGISMCDEDGEGCKYSEESCTVEYAISEEWSYSCSNVNCRDYSFSLEKESSGEFEIDCNTSVSDVLVARYIAPPDCFEVLASTTSNLISVSQKDMGDGYIGIYIDSDAVDKASSPTIDVNVYIDGTVCGEKYDMIKIKLCGN